MQGDAELKRWSLFASSSKFEAAVDCFQKAANCYKMVKKCAYCLPSPAAGIVLPHCTPAHRLVLPRFATLVRTCAGQEAGDAFSRCADCQTHLKSPHEAATFYVEAANCFKKVDPSSAMNFFRNAIALYCELGRFTTAAKHQQAIAELHEEDGELTEAIENYQQASDYYLGEDAKAKSNACLLKIATFASDEKIANYDRAIDIFEQVAETCLEKPLTKYNAKGYYLQAGFCVLCKGDTVAMRQKLDRYKDKDLTFADCRECKFLEDLTQDCEDYNVDDFTEHVYAFDNISKLDAWKTSILLRVKKAIESTGDDAVDLT